MEKEARRRQKKVPAATRPPATVHDVPHHVLRRIFRLLDTHITVIRAAAVCKRWRAIASTRGIFADGYRHEFFKRHPGPHVLGHYHVADPSYALGPAKPQRRSVFVPALPSIDARHFSLDFLPRGHSGRPWKLVDGGGSLLLLATNQRRRLFPDLVVCEPITRRYVRINPMEGMKYHTCLGVFLSIYVSMSEFVVKCVVYEPSEGMNEEEDVGRAMACTYTHLSPRSKRVRNGWTVPWRASSGWNIRGAGSLQYVGRAAGKMFWARKDDGTTVLAASDAGIMFWDLHLPEHVRGSPQDLSKFRFVDNGVKGEVDVARLATVIGDELRILTWNLFDSYEWELERRLNLPEATLGLKWRKEGYFHRAAKIVTARKGFVVLTPAEETWLFSVDLRTMQVERDSCQNKLAGEVYPYELLTPPQIRAVRLPCKKDRRGACYDICICY